MLEYEGKKNFRQRKMSLSLSRAYQHPYECIRAAFQVYSWAALHGDPPQDCVSADGTYTGLMGLDEQTAGQVANTKNNVHNRTL